MLNQAVFIGRLVSDPELRDTSNGVKVTSFAIAVDRPFQRSGAERVTDFFDVVAWRNMAEFITKFFHKGNLLCVQGYMTTRTYTDKNGVNRKAYELIAEHAHFVESKRDLSTHNPTDPAEAHASGDTSEFIEGDDGDLPF